MPITRSAGRDRARTEAVLSAVESRLAQRVTVEPLFVIRWQVA
jgi:hypothetical protein